MRDIFKGRSHSQEETKKRGPIDEVMRRAKNRRRDSSSQDKYWKIEGTSTLIDEDISTPEAASNKLEAIEKCCKELPRRPYEWLSDKGEKRLIALKEKNPDLVRSCIRLLKYDSRSSQEKILYLEKELKDLKDLRAKYKNLKYKNLISGPNKDISEGALKKVTINTTLTKVSLLVMEKEIITRQQNALETEKKKLDKVNDKAVREISKEETSVTQSPTSSEVKEWHRVTKHAEKINRNLQAKIDRREARIKKIDALLALPGDTLATYHYGSDTIEEVMR